MTERQCKEILREDVLPVILGNSRHAHRLSLRLYLQYGLTSLLCAERKGIRDLLDPSSTFFPLISGEPRLICEQLCDLAAREEGRLLLLIPAEEKTRARLEGSLDSLESAFVLTDPSRLDRWLFPCARYTQKRERYPYL